MKRFDSTKLFKLACQDVVERFHLLISLLFVLVSSQTCLLPACNAALLHHAQFLYCSTVSTIILVL